MVWIFFFPFVQENQFESNAPGPTLSSEVILSANVSKLEITESLQEDVKNVPLDEVDGYE